MITAVLGHGTVGRCVVSILDSRDDFQVKYILELPDKCTESRMISDIHRIMEDPEVETVVDALPAVHPSYEFIKLALTSGKNVVTSNKAALCYGFEELMRLASERQVSLCYEASCGGTIPDIREAMSLSQTNTIKACYGIMNGTTNFILDSMLKKGSGFEETLKQAQSLGYAEADPTADISGYDVKNKIVILSATAYHAFLSPDFPVCGIEKITKDILSALKEEGKTVKLLGLSVREQERYAMGVVPVVLPLSSLEASVPSNFNLFTLEASNAGTVKLYGQGAGGVPTADAMVRDLCSIASGNQFPGTDSFTGQMISDPSLLTGTAWIGNEKKQGILAQLAEEAAARDCFFAFEPDFLK